MASAQTSWFVKLILVLTGSAGPRNPVGIHKHIAWGISFGFAAFYLYTAFFGMISATTHLGVYFMLTYVLVFAYFKRSKSSPNDRPELIDYALILLTVVCLVYWIVQYETLMFSLGWEPDDFVTVLGIVTVVLSLEAARRVSGFVIPILAIVFLLYAYLGPYMPQVLRHSGYPVWRIVEFAYLTNEGMLGQITNIFASYIFIFIIFGAFLEKSGLGQLFIDSALAFTGHLTGGPGIVATIGSGMSGMITGSPVANVVTTGPFTIPLMKKAGYTPEFAGAVEAAASTGGQYMPPIMGAAAFILADFTGTPYMEVVAVSIVPAILYFMSVGVMVYLRARKQNLLGLPKDELPTKLSVLKRVHFFLPVVAIIGLMLFGYSPFYAACWAIILTVALSWTSKKYAMKPKMIADAMAAGAKSSLRVGGLVGCLGIILAMSLLTGLPSLLAGALTKLSFGMLPLLLFWLIVCGYIVGMGLPATPAYLILALFGVPALTKFGVPVLASHLIVFWVAVSSVVTPPVALASMAASSISGGEFYRTSMHSVQLASWLFLMPFLFVYTSLLMPNGLTLDVVITICASIVGLIAWAMAMQAYAFYQINGWERLLLFAAALMLLHENMLTDVVGLAILLFVYLKQRYYYRKEKLATAS